jgi:hypothetical protein
MGWIGKAAAVAAVVTACFMGAGAAGAQTSGRACKNACSTAHTACQKRAINSDTCMRRWLVCKKKCSGRLPSNSPASAPVRP